VGSTNPDLAARLTRFARFAGRAGSAGAATTPLAGRTLDVAALIREDRDGR
jgi:hypothetical protein